MSEKVSTQQNEQPEDYYQKSARVYDEQATKSLPQTIKPKIADINEDIRVLCEESPGEYHCRELGRVAYWLANPAMHDDPVFRVACSGTLSDPGEHATRDIRYHTHRLMSHKRHPATIAQAIYDFENYFGMDSKKNDAE